MTSKNENIQSLEIKDCEILNIATGIRAQNLKELRDTLKRINSESIYYHFWTKKLRPGFEENEFNNDFANWAHSKLHHNKLAERFSIINPGMFSDIEEVRSKLLDVIERTIEEDQLEINSKESEKFQFTQGDIVLFNTDFIVSKPEELTELIPNLTLGSIYFHFIESKNGPGCINRFVSNAGDGYSKLGIELSKLDPYFFNLPELQSRTSQIFIDFFKGGGS